jgi:hypothetical protein
MTRTTILVCPLLVWLAVTGRAWACGGGWAPFVPTQQTAGSSSSSQKSDLTTTDKGVSYDLFNDKELQPVIRDILMRGNVRKNRRRTENADSTEQTEPVLNIQRLH